MRNECPILQSDGREGKLCVLLAIRKLSNVGGVRRSLFSRKAGRLLKSLVMSVSTEDRFDVGVRHTIGTVPRASRRVLRLVARRSWTPDLDRGSNNCF